MDTRSAIRTGGRWLGASAALFAGTYAAYAAVTWVRYGHPRRPQADERDGLLDRFMPAYDVVDRHGARVAAPAEVTLAAAREMDLYATPLVAAIFRARELALGATAAAPRRPQGLLAEMQALGWVVLAERPGREVVAGAVTRPWEPDVTFRGIPPDAFATFAEPGYVKIAWTLRADPDGPDASIFRTETRAVATDAEARARFRRYWAWLSPGIIMIRWLTLGPLRRAAERRARASPRPREFPQS